MPFALIENDIVVSTSDEASPIGEWVSCDSHDIHGFSYNSEDGTFTDNREVPADPVPEIPAAYIGLNFSLEDIQACEDGTKTIEQVQAEMAE